MATTTSVNGQTVVHQTSGGELNTSPDVCLTPTGSSIVPIPYNNTAVSKDTSGGSASVFVDGNSIMLKDSVFSKSAGDEPGVALGIGSGTTGGVAQFTNYSFDVKVEGRNVCRRLDPMTSNNGNTPPAALMQPNVEAEGVERLHLLPIAFVYKQPDASEENIQQPRFNTPHKVNGFESFKSESHEYVGVMYKCKREGEYTLTFDEFSRAEGPFEDMGDENDI
jgi:hypothetical protein